MDHEQRIDWLDILNGIGIFLLVWGHCGRQPATYNWLYNVHIPLLYVISGMVMRLKAHDSDTLGGQILLSARQILYPYLGFSLVSLLYRYTMHLTLKTGFSLAGELRLFRNLEEGALWILPALFLGHFLFFALAKIRLNRYLILILSCAVCVFCAQRMPEKTHHLYRLLLIASRGVSALFWVTSGSFAADHLSLFLPCGTRRERMTMVFLGLGLVIGMIILSHYNSSVDLHYTRLGNPLLFFSIGIGSISGLALLSYCLSTSSRTRIISVLRYLGRNALIILGTHTNLRVVYLSHAYVRRLMPVSDKTLYSLLVAFFTLVIEFLIIGFFTHSLKPLFNYKACVALLKNFVRDDRPKTNTPAFLLYSLFAVLVLLGWSVLSPRKDLLPVTVFGCFLLSGVHIICLLKKSLQRSLEKEILLDWCKTVFLLLLLSALYICIKDRSIRVINKPLDDRLTPDVVMYLALLTSFMFLYGRMLIKNWPAKIIRILYDAAFALSPVIALVICEIACNGVDGNFRGIGTLSLVLNVALWAIIEVVIVNLFHKKSSYGLIVLYTIALLAGTANHFILQFRRTPVMAVDLLSLAAAKAVYKQYVYKLDARLAVALLATLLSSGGARALACSGIEQKKRSLKKTLLRLGTAVLFAIVGFVWVWRVDWGRVYNIKSEWPAIMYMKNGFLVSFVASYHKMKVHRPEGYSPERSKMLLSAWKDDKGNEKFLMTEEKPLIITIMNEAFSDLSVLGPLDCVKDHLKFFNSLKNDPGTLEFGINYVSTIGGGTAKSEFEYLTGFSLAWLPGSIPYSQYDFSTVPTLVKTLKRYGYKTIAMHPENPYNWRRNVVYPEMGFDEFIARKDFEGYQKTIWNRISDKGNYDKILDVIKEHDEPLFIFNITMQNHGWYDINLFPPKQRAKVDKQYENYKPLQAYETLLVQSDEALRSLVGRLKKMRRPVVLCFFGDHQPPMRKDIVDAISQQGRSAWDTELSLTQKTFAVPYFIWSNVKHRSFSDDTIMNERGTIASTNYLGALTLMYADLPLTEYDAFLINMRRTVQAINEYGAMNADQEWHFISDDLKDRALLNDYENLQYYMMMDRARQ